MEGKTFHLQRIRSLPIILWKGLRGQTLDQKSRRRTVHVGKHNLWRSHYVPSSFR